MTVMLRGKVNLNDWNHIMPIRQEDNSIDEKLLLGVFMLSGGAALIYQISWQRLLFAAFGVDIESITIIVSTFMLGLGVGALIGGAIADRFGHHLVQFFVACELGIAIFGFLSPDLIPWAGEYFVQSGLFIIALVNFLLILIPTTFMGATLPMLVTHLFKRSNNVGVSVGSLYFVNTVGAALGSFAAGIILFNLMTLNQSIYLAACTNVLVSALAMIGLRRKNK